jgi:signal transduction histidine kinase
MFKKLRREILWLCMVLTSVITLTSFAVIYWTTASSASDGEKITLAEVTASAVGDTITQSADGVYAESIIQTQFSPSFVIDMDTDGNIQNAHSSLSISDEIYAQAAKSAYENGSVGIVRLGGRVWRYAVDATKHVTVDMDGGDVDMSGGTEGLRAAFLDVTDSRAATARLGRVLIVAAVVVLALIFCVSLLFSAKAVRPVEEVWEKQKQFIANASHELKTPLTIVMSNLGALTANGGETVDSQMKWISRIRAGCDRMSGLINELLRLARMDAQDAEKTTEPVNVGETINEAIDREDARIAQKRLRVETAIPSDIVIQSDGDKLAQLVSILLDNAVKYTDEGGNISIELTKSAKAVRFCIKNSGAGIAPQELPMIFERFYRASDAPKGDGSSYGLGLSVAKAIVTSLGGEIAAVSVPSGDTQFAVTLRAGVAHLSF